MPWYATSAPNASQQCDYFLVSCFPLLNKPINWCQCTGSALPTNAFSSHCVHPFSEAFGVFLKRELLQYLF